jgi:hypothetical protein
MQSGLSRSIVIGFTFLASLGPWTAAADAQQAPAIEVVFPNQLVRGQTNVLHLAIPSREVFQGAEVSPAAGVTVSSVTNYKKAELSQNVAWWEVTINVANDAAPGNRSLVLLMATGRTAPTTVVIPNHVPVISDLRIVSASGIVPAPANRSAVDVQFAAVDQSADLGDLPYVWFTISCGGEPTVGVVRGKTTAGVVRASIPRPAAAACDLELRASDAQKIDSNTLKTRIP